MSDQAQTPATQPQPSPNTQTPATPPTNPGEVPQQAVPPSLPISPFTGQPYDPAWGIPLQKGASSERELQQVIRAETERKASKPDGEAKK